MNLRAAQKELDGRGPKVTPQWLAIEAVVVIGISIALVGVFA